MPDWLSSMQQTFEYYVVDPGTWRDSARLDIVKSCTINRDSEVGTLGSATIDIIDSVGECYVRVYLITIQNGVREKHPLGTYMIQTPTSSFNGKVRQTSVDAYTPLMELKEKVPPIGYSIYKGIDIMPIASELAQENMRAPVIVMDPVSDENSKTLVDHFVSNPDDTWLTYLTDLISNAQYTFDVDELGRILFAPKQDIASLQPVWTYDDSNSSILYPELTIDHDLFGIPNVVEAVYTSGSDTYYSRVVNYDEDSPVSTVSRGREIVHRVTNPELVGAVNQGRLDEYAKELLETLSSVAYTVSYKHGYCPVRVGDCVRLNYERAGLTGIKAKVVSQSISCEPGCPVTEKAVFTTKLWG